METPIRYNDGHVAHLAQQALQLGATKGFLHVAAIRVEPRSRHGHGVMAAPEIAAGGETSDFGLTDVQTETTRETYEDLTGLPHTWPTQVESWVPGDLEEQTAPTAPEGRMVRCFTVLHQNLLFCFSNEATQRPGAVFLLEGCRCDAAEEPNDDRAGEDPLLTRRPGQVRLRVSFEHTLEPPLDLWAESIEERELWILSIRNCSYQAGSQEHEAHSEASSPRKFQGEPGQGVAPWPSERIPDGSPSSEGCKGDETSDGPGTEQENEYTDIWKIKKVQSFLRGWLCRRKWKAIVQDYIRSPQAEARRSRNRLVFAMLEAEADYVTHLKLLVSGFLRPLRMAASSRRPPISHDDVSAIFLNSETIMFLHQIFYQGLKARMASWPTIVLADLFDILLPMLNIYQEFVRNHQFSLQVLANCKQNRDFDKLLQQYEARTECEGRTLDTLITYPMFQIPRYIVTLHELLAHTPPEHIERRSLEFAKSKLEELSRIMHDEVSETENIRKNLAVERMIVEGCDVLLDTSQTFVRQGSLIQLATAGERGRCGRGRLGSLTARREGERQCFLFSKHLLICTRTSGGKLHLIKGGGVISLAECTLLEDPEPSDDETRGAVSELDFRLVVQPAEGSSFMLALMAGKRQEKAAWTSDISQCIENLRCNSGLPGGADESLLLMRGDAGLMSDGPDIRFRRPGPHDGGEPVVRAASVSRLLERLTDPRGLTIDFLNTFLCSYRAFTTADAVLARLACAYRRPLSALPARSLELFFTPSLHGNRMALAEPPKSPRACRKFSTPLGPPTPGLGSPSPILSTSSSGVTPLTPPGLSFTPPLMNLASSPPARVRKCSLQTPPVLGVTFSAVCAPDSALRARKMSLTTPGLLDKPFSKGGLAVASGSGTAVGSPPEVTPPTTPPNSGQGESPPMPHEEEAPEDPKQEDSTNNAGGHTGSMEASTGSRHEKIRRLSLAGFPLAEPRVSDRELMVRQAVTNRVLNVLRHWASKHGQDFELDSGLRDQALGLLQEISRDSALPSAERRAVSNIVRTLTQQEPEESQLTLERVTLMYQGLRIDGFDAFSAVELGEQLTLLDHLIFRSILHHELFGQCWMKADKWERAPNIMQTTRHFNEVSNLVAWEIVKRPEPGARAAVIEKWLAIADLCRSLNNFNGVLEVHSALTRTAVFRLRKTWLKLPKQTKTLFEKTQKAMSSDGRFKNLREKIKSCDPPCVPYLGMYLTDMAMIEEATPNITPDGLVNFSKMRMITNIIREIQQFQQTPYRIETDARALHYLLDRSNVPDDDALYELSLKLEPRLPT
uniref:ras-specific guanine nucleotide-releasing factor 2-like n=1 Tax=Myxine glutinosa TaxID=7769 RepID=UPI00358FB209